MSLEWNDPTPEQLARQLRLVADQISLLGSDYVNGQQEDLFEHAFGIMRVALSLGTNPLFPQ